MIPRHALAALLFVTNLAHAADVAAARRVFDDAGITGAR